MLSKIPSTPVAVVAVAAACWALASLGRGMHTLIAFWKIAQPIGGLKYLAFDVIPLLSQGIILALVAGAFWWLFCAINTSRKRLNED